MATRTIDERIHDIKTLVDGYNQEIMDRLNEAAACPDKLKAAEMVVDVIRQFPRMANGLNDELIELAEAFLAD